MDETPDAKRRRMKKGTRKPKEYVVGMVLAKSPGWFKIVAVESTSPWMKPRYVYRIRSPAECDVDVGELYRFILH